MLTDHLWSPSSALGRYSGGVRCLLATDLDTPRQHLRRVMDGLGVDLVEVDQLTDDWLTQEQTPAIDFMCGVLRTSVGSEAEAAIYIDIGVALGRRIPVLLVVEPPRNVPLVIAGLTRVDARLDNVDALKLHLGQFIRANSRKSIRVPSPAGSPSLSSAQVSVAHMQLDDLRDIESNFRGASSAGIRFEQLAYDLLTNRDAQVVAHRTDLDFGYDMALWVEGASQVIGRPILIALKLWKSSSPGRIDEAANRLAERVVKQGAPFGMLIYHTVKDADWQITLAGGRAPVVVMPAHTLVEMLGRNSLSRLLITMRNSIVHGVLRA